MTDPLLEFDGVDVSYRTSVGDLHAVSNVSLTVDRNEYFGLLGESGCGKSTLAKSIFGGLASNGRVSGTIRYKGDEIQDYTEAEFNDEIRWNEIAVIPQAAMNSLDPLMRVSEQAATIAGEHEGWSKQRTMERLEDLFDVVGIPASRITDYPHQFSGGMRQRAIIAISLLLEPSLLVADEPTTALDVVMQHQILEYLSEIREERDVSLVFITHDISVIFENCDSVAVMHGGQVAETGSVRDILDRPRHPYTILLQEAFPDIRYPNRELEDIEGTPPTLHGDVDYCTFADRCPWAQPKCRDGAPPLEPLTGDGGHQTSCVRDAEMEDLASEYLASDPHAESASSAPGGDSRSRADGASSRSASSAEPVLHLDGVEKHFRPSANVIDSIRTRLFGGEQSRIRAVDGVDLELETNQVQGLIGESGCGKTTLLLTLMGQYQPTAGEISFQGTPVSEFDRGDWKAFRRRVQMIFQNPFDTMNPKFTVRDALREPLKIHGLEQSEERLHRALDQVRLNPTETYIDRRESQLSGGEKQRVAIARALIVDPDVILADEPVSMLDVSTQASILRLLNDLTSELDVSMFYVSHDLSTVSYVCDRVNVMYLGRIVESAPTEEVIFDPKHPYTRALIQAIPVPDPDYDREEVRIAGSPGDASELPSGCRFKDRCPERMDVCDRRPVFESIDGDASRQVACHLYGDDEPEVESASAAPGGEVVDNG